MLIGEKHYLAIDASFERLGYSAQQWGSQVEVRVIFAFFVYCVFA